MHGALPLLLLVTSNFETRATVGLAAENRTGQRPVNVAGDETTVTEIEVTPAAGLGFRFKTVDIALRYSPRIYTRLDLVDGAASDSRRPLFLHQFGADYTHRLTSKLTLGIGGGGSVGEVDYSGINLVQGTSQQVQTDDGQSTSAAGRLPEGASTFSSQNYTGSANLSWRALKNHTFSLGASGGYNAPFGDDTSSQTFPEQYSIGGVLGWDWRFHPNYAFSMGFGGGQSWVEVDGLGTGRFSSASVNAGLSLRINRLFNMGFGGGVLVADNRPADPMLTEAEGISAIPLGNASFTFIPTSGKGPYHVTTTFAAGIQGFIDPLQAEGYVPRVAASWSLALTFFEDWSFNPSATLATPATLEPSDSSSGTLNSLNETWISFSLPLTYRIASELSVAGGATFSARGTHLGADPVEFSDWFALGFLRFVASYDTVL